MFIAKFSKLKLKDTDIRKSKVINAPEFGKKNKVAEK